MDSEQRGRESQQKGERFEEHCAELYRLLAYSVEVGRLFGGRQVDLFLTRRVDDLSVYRAVECKAGKVSADDIDSFLRKLSLVRKEYPSALGTLLANEVTDSVMTHAHHEGVQVTLFRDLQAHLFDGHRYATSLLRNAETDSNYETTLYVPPTLAGDIVGLPMVAPALIATWLTDVRWRHLSILGDAGGGKSFLARMTARQLAHEFLSDPLRNRLPLYLDLRQASPPFTVEHIVRSHLASSGLPSVSFETFLYHLRSGRLVLLMDDFDALASQATLTGAIGMLDDLARMAGDGAKTLLTCRTHFFANRIEEEEILLGGAADFGGLARELYWDLIARRDSHIVYIEPFSASQIESYLDRRLGPLAHSALEALRDAYNLMDLATNPLLLSMICRSIDRIDRRELSIGEVYEVFTRAWIHRDRHRTTGDGNARRDLVTAIARATWESGGECVQVPLPAGPYGGPAAQYPKPTHGEPVFDDDLRSASFLARTPHGEFRIAHSSFVEFFVAQDLVRRLKVSDRSSLGIRRLSAAIVAFVADLAGNSPTLEACLQGALEGHYIPKVSENALLCLYEIRRRRASSAGSAERFAYIPIGRRLNLSGARLESLFAPGIDLAGADLRGALLSGVTLASAQLDGALLDDCRLDAADLSGASCRGSSFKRVYAKGVNLDKCNLTGADFAEANLTHCFIRSALTEHVVWSDSDLTGAVLDESLIAELDDSGRATAAASEGNQTLVDEYWDWIGRTRDALIARALGETSSRVSAWRDFDEVLSALFSEMTAPGTLGPLMRLSDESRTTATVAMIAARLKRGSGKTLRRRRSGGRTRHLYQDVNGLLQQNDIDTPEHKHRSGTDRAVTDTHYDGYHGQWTDDPIAAAMLVHDLKKLVSAELWPIVAAHHIEGFSIDEIAAKQGVSSHDIEEQLRRATQSIRAHYGVG